jgi:prepilin-type N-terminal cleavage/methylation domain-containing protein
MFSLISKFRQKTNDDRGFTITEMIIATAIIASIAAAFAAFAVSLASTQRSSNLDKIASRALADQVELVDAMMWDDIMLTPANGYSDCDLPENRVSKQTVRTGPETVNSDGIDISITRDVRWYITGSQVKCAGADKDRAELKVITLTAAWNDNGKTQTSTVSILRSRSGEADAESRTLPPQRSLFLAAPTGSPSGWCTGSTTVDGNVSVVFSDSGPSSCGYSVTGLTVGKHYTAIMEVFVPTDSTVVELEAQYMGRGGQGLPNGTWQTLVYTWYETATSREVGVATADDGTRPSGSSVQIRALRIYEN